MQRRGGPLAPLRAAQQTTMHLQEEPKRSKATYFHFLQSSRNACGHSWALVTIVVKNIVNFLRLYMQRHVNSFPIPSVQLPLIFNLVCSFQSCVFRHSCVKI
jgi:hypothetical protein